MTPDALVLIGFRGAGKSVLAHELAKTLGWERVSTDELITAGIQADGAGGASIAEFVERGGGWSAFREREYKAVASLELPNSTVLDCGGGVVERDDTMRLLVKLGAIVWVQADLDDVLCRLALDTNAAQRPALSHADWEEDARQNFTRRLPLYERHAQFSVNTSQNTVQQCVDGIVEHYAISFEKKTATPDYL